MNYEYTEVEVSIDHQQKFGWYEYYVDILIFNSVTQRFLK